MNTNIAPKTNQSFDALSEAELDLIVGGKEAKNDKVEKEKTVTEVAQEVAQKIYDTIISIASGGTASGSTFKTLTDTISGAGK